MVLLTNYFIYFFNNFILIFTVSIFLIYVMLAIISGFTLRNYLRKNSYVDYNSIILAPLIPSVAILTPAFNESKSIIDNVKALLGLYYNDLEVIIINDGSSDDTLEKLIETFKLEKVTYAFEYRLVCERIRGIYKSNEPNFRKLIVIDKVNGGKSDSLNAGINVSSKKLIVSIDADTIMEPDALLKLVKPFIEETDKKVIGTGGVIRIANSCEINGGQVRAIHLPRKFLARAQVLEYTRAFLMTRMAWSRLDGLLLISGALGMFDKEVVIQCGGYNINTVGEDMELVVRMRRYMVQKKQKYVVTYVPDPLVWTEVPEDYKTFARQRNRWTRGTIETLYLHRKLFLNPKYGKFSFFGYTYWLFFEWLAPIIEFLGLLYFIVLVILGQVNWSFFILLFVFVYTFSVCLSIYAVLFEELTYHKYQRRRDVLKMAFTSFFEPFFFHPMNMVLAIKANFDYFSGKRSWGKMERKGFYTKKLKGKRITYRLRSRGKGDKEINKEGDEK
jgi:poly-beta-1,6-N-acetyl-D-glucosamine synthase